MRLPGWLDVALEGGALELQRALVRYRGLRRRVSGDWRPRASLIAEDCAALARSEAAVGRALDRAMRRARVDPHAGAAAHLAIAVEKERRRTAAVLADVCGEDGTLAELLGLLEGTARDECYVESAWRRFNAERLVWTVLLAFGAASIPLGSWWSASAGGAVQTYFALDGLLDVPVYLLAGFWLTVGQLRALAWSWLGIAVRPWMAAASVTLTLTGLVGAMVEAIPVVAAAIALLTMVALTTLRSVWFLSAKPLLGA